MKLSHNLFLNTLNTLLNICFPVLTLPIVARALGPDALGSVNLVISLTTTFTGFANIGITVFGIVSVARLKTRGELANHFYNLIFLQAIGAFTAWVIYQGLVYSYGGWQHDTTIYQIGGACIFCTFLTSEWFYTGRQNFLFMTVRNLAIRLINLALIVLFVRTPQDNVLYMVTLLIGISGSQLINFVFAAVHLPLTGVKIRPAGYVRKLFVYGPLQLANFFQLGFDKICLGYMAAASTLAFYTLSDRICLIVISLVNGVTGVMVPYFSKNFAENGGKTCISGTLIRKNYLALSLYLPIVMLLIIGIDMTGHNWSVILFGHDFRYVGTVLAVMKWNLIIYTLTRMLANMYFLPCAGQAMYMRSLLSGAVLQLILIPAGMHFGNVLWASGGLALANFVVLGMMIYAGRADMLPLLHALVTSRDNLRRIAAGIIVYLAFLVLPGPAGAHLIAETFYSLAIVLSYGIVLFILRDSQLSAAAQKIIGRRRAEAGQ